MSEKKFGKRLLTWVLVIVMMLTVVPLNVLAKDGDKSNNTSSGNDKWSPKVEFWCTNATVNVGSYGTSTNLSTLLSGKDSLYFANESFCKAVPSISVVMIRVPDGSGRPSCRTQLISKTVKPMTTRPMLVPRSLRFSVHGMVIST